MPDDVSSDRMMIDTLVELARTLRDSEAGCRTAADDTTDPQLMSVFNGLARTRTEQAEELEAQIRRGGGQPAPRGGSTPGALHRYFLDLKSALAGNDRLAILEEVVRGESHAEAAYDRAKRQPLSDEIRRIVQRQHDSVKASRDRFRAMKQAERGEAAGLLDRAAETMSRVGERLYRRAPRRLDDVTAYVAERPMATTLAAMGIGFALGALVTALGRSAGSPSARPER